MNSLLQVQHRAFIISHWVRGLHSLHLMVVNVIFKHSLLHGITDEGAEGAHPVTLLVLIQLVLGDARELLLTVTTLQGQLGQQCTMSQC